MNVCVLFILFNGVGYVTPDCLVDSVYYEPQDVVYVQHIPDHYADCAHKSPSHYVNHYRHRQRRIVRYKQYRYSRYSYNHNKQYRRTHRHAYRHYAYYDGSKASRDHQRRWNRRRHNHNHYNKRTTRHHRRYGQDRRHRRYRRGR